MVRQPPLAGRVAATLLMAIGSTGACADALNSLLAATEQTTPIIDLRLRSEQVDQTGIAKDADAVTLRARLGFETGKAWDTALLAEAGLTSPLVERYNSTVNGKTAYPIVADPENYVLNRLQLANTSIPGTTVLIGRQRINLDDQRFVASVDWRQNEQTFDAARIINKSIPKLTFDLTYLDQVNRVYGKDSPVGRYTGNSYLLNVGYDTPIGKLTAFDYLLDFHQAQTDSSQTAGVRLGGQHPVGAIRLAYMVSWATQGECAHNPVHYTEDYYIAQLTGTFRQFSLGGGLEVLQGNGVKGFTTPLATFHRWDGWDDKFLTTPPSGLERRYLTLGYSTTSVGFLDSISATAVYHDFRSNHLDLHYGSEVDLLLQGKWRRFTGLVKFADYVADRLFTDTRKLWSVLDYIW